MIINCADTPDRTIFEADIVIIGAGAMGLALTADLLDSGLSILLLEAGGTQATPSNDDMLDVEIVGHPFYGANMNGRRRILGGATTLWGGQFLELPDIVFEERSWIAESGWPITKTELKPFYQRIATFAGLRQQEGSEDIWRCHGIKPPGYNRNLFISEFSRWSSKPDFGVNMYKILQDSHVVRVLLNASVTELRLDNHGSIKEVIIKSVNGFTATAKGRVFVLAAGAIESARLLLASNNQDKRGVGNRFGLVGRYFQDHTSLRVAKILPRDRSSFHELYENFFIGATKYAPKITLAEYIQRDEQLLNVGGFFHFPSDGHDGLSALKAIVGQLKRRRNPEKLLSSLKSSVTDIPEVMKFLYSLKVKNRIRAKRQGDIMLEIHAEQEPDYESCIRLSCKVDALGMPLAQVDWRVSDRSRIAVLRYVESVQSEFNRLAIADVELIPDLIDNAHSFQHHLRDVYHQMGTLRMSRDASAGVTNLDARMHEVPNLYIAGCSLFPVSGYSNPTYTGLALASRLADHLCVQLGAR